MEEGLAFHKILDVCLVGKDLERVLAALVVHGSTVGSRICGKRRGCDARCQPAGRQRSGLRLRPYLLDESNRTETSNGKPCCGVWKVNCKLSCWCS